MRVPGLVVLAGMAVAAGSSAAAGEASRFCEPYLDLLSDIAPRFQSVAPDAGRLRFVKDDTEGSGCPNPTAACAARAYLVPGDGVVVTRTLGDYVCAAFVGGPPRFQTSYGWLPRGGLADAAAPPSGPAAWLGQWTTGGAGTGATITIRAAGAGRIAIVGAAIWGGDDPARVAKLGVHLGDFAAEVTPSQGRVAFTFDDNDQVVDGRVGSADSVACSVRLWLFGRLLAVADNRNCGGLNVTFTGFYLPGPVKASGVSRLP